MSTRGRHGTRRLLVQALYQSQVGGHGADELRAQFAASDDYGEVDVEYFNALLDEVLADRPALDQRIDAHADRPVEQLDPVERAVLWVGLIELSAHPQVPTKVAINEAVELAKEFGAQDSFRFINAILDKAARDLR